MLAVFTKAEAIWPRNGKNLSSEELDKNEV